LSHAAFLVPPGLHMTSLRSLYAPAALGWLGLTLVVSAQPPAAAPRAAAQVDLTGYWVAQITEDWRWRMITPPKGDYTSVPLNAHGREVAGNWDRERDASTGEACRAFGAGGLLRQPTRLKIDWADDATLRIESDAGEQVRLLHFDRSAPRPAEPTWQGHSLAEFTAERPPANPFGPALVAPTSEASAARAGGAAQAGGGAPAASRGTAPAATPSNGGVKAVTTNLRPGYLRKNGVPYGAGAVVTEYFDRLSLFGSDYLEVLTIVDDPEHLATPFAVSNHFKREPDGSKWNPTPCATDAPLGTFQPPVIVQ
jgi:hypothetical protein